MDLKQARELIGIGSLALDREAGLHRGATSEIETGKNKRPSHETVVRIVRALRRLGLKGAEAESIFPVPDGDEGAEVGAKAS